MGSLELLNNFPLDSFHSLDLGSSHWVGHEGLLGGFNSSDLLHKSLLGGFNSPDLLYESFGGMADFGGVGDGLG